LYPPPFPVNVCTPPARNTLLRVRACRFVSPFHGFRLEHDPPPTCSRLFPLTWFFFQCAIGFFFKLPGPTSDHEPGFGGCPPPHSVFFSTTALIPPVSGTALRFLPASPVTNNRNVAFFFFATNFLSPTPSSWCVPPAKIVIGPESPPAISFPSR